MPISISVIYQPNTEILFDSIKDLPYASWLDSHHSGYDIITALPSERLLAFGSETQLIKYTESGQTDTDHNKAFKAVKSDPFTMLRQWQTALKDDLSEYDTQRPFPGGILGLIAYDRGRYELGLQNENSKNPDMQFGLFHWSLIQDHQQQKSWLNILPSCPAPIRAQIEGLIPQINGAVTSKNNNTPFVIESILPCISAGEYHQKIHTIKNYIAAGDCYQVNFAQRFQGRYRGQPYSAYRHLRRTMEAPFSAWLDLGDEQILSFSPERFLQVQNGRVLTQPIKGTAPRDSDKTVDEQNAKTLHASEKNRAENVMIVDLLRNDLGKHCKPGSIRVPELFKLHSFSNVHHLISDVVGELRDDSDSLDLLRDAFPGGSITGAPKKRAMEIIDELEQGTRGAYCGSIVWLDGLGNMDSSILIRTVSCKQGQITCWAGGGIVADSEAESEYEETFNKINAILDGLKSIS